MNDEKGRFALERQRILEEYERRGAEVDDALYAPWNAAQQLALTERRLRAAQMLRRAGAFPAPGDPCLEIGFGRLGWLADLLAWGLRCEDLHGIELDAARTEAARHILPGADLRCGDATRLPWDDASFELIIASTVFTSVLDPEMRHQLAREIVRALRPGGVLLFYDFRFDNPRNPNVRKVDRLELRHLFPDLDGEVSSLTLAPPLARRVAPVSGALAIALAALPFLRTHLIAVLRRPE